MSEFSTSESAVVAHIHLGKPLLRPRQSLQVFNISVVLNYEIFGIIPDSDLLSLCNIRARLVAQGNDDDIRDVDFEHTVIKNNRAFFQLLPPIKTGVYSLVIWAHSPPTGYFILPLVLFDVEICDELPLRQDFTCLTYRPFPDAFKLMLAEQSLRKVWHYHSTEDIMNSDLLIKEERGRTIGSHVWDSAVLFSNYVPEMLQMVGLSADKKNGLMSVELGAGVGLVSFQLALSGIFSTLYLTDVASQLSQTQENIDLNLPKLQDAVGNVAVMSRELDWLDNASITQFEKQLGDNSIDLITATDVLYAQNLADSFFGVIRRIATPGYTKILLAQKMRGAETLVNLDDLSNFDTIKLIELCGVRVYEVKV